MKPIILAALAPLALGACNFGAPGGNTATANASAPNVVPDSVTVNGVVYTRAGAASAPAAASTPSTPFPMPSTASTATPPPIGDGSSTTPADSGALPSGGETPAATSGSHGG